MGLEVLKGIRAQPGRALTVIILTASAENADIEAAYRLGANGFLTKPTEANKLREMVKAIKDFWLTHNTLPRESTSESPMEGAVSLGYASADDFSENHRSPASREERPQEVEAT